MHFPPTPTAISSDVFWHAFLIVQMRIKCSQTSNIDVELQRDTVCAHNHFEKTNIRHALYGAHGAIWKSVFPSWSQACIFTIIWRQKRGVCQSSFVPVFGARVFKTMHFLLGFKTMFNQFTYLHSFWLIWVGFFNHASLRWFGVRVLKIINFYMGLQSFWWPSWGPKWTFFKNKRV